LPLPVLGAGLEEAGVDDGEYDGDGEYPGAEDVLPRCGAAPDL